MVLTKAVKITTGSSLSGITGGQCDGRRKGGGGDDANDDGWAKDAGGGDDSDLDVNDVGAAVALLQSGVYR